MEIAFIHPSWPGDEGTGATHTATQVVTGLSNRGHNVTVYCTEKPPKERQEPSGLELEYIYLPDFPPHTNTKLNRALKSRVEEFDKYDVINCYLSTVIPAMSYIGQRTSSAVGITLNAYGAVCPKNDLLYMDEEKCTQKSLFRCSKCVSLTSSDHDEFSTPYRIVSRLGNLRLLQDKNIDTSHIDFFRSPSGHVKSNYVDFGFPADKIHVIPHPLNETFRMEHRSNFNSPYNILYVGYLEKQKGVDKLIPILSKLKEQVDEKVSLSIVGKGGLRTRMEQQAHDLSVRDSVDFMGFVPNEKLPTIYANHDLFIYPGIWDEPLARVYLEALATGTPIISSDYGDIRSILGNGGVITDGTVEGFVSAISDIITNKRFDQISEDAKLKSNEYQADQVLPKIEKVYSTASEIDE
ncbi:glycosyltransferase family 4 protein [Natrinema salaciae]|uniref:Glycosyltransferase involved in cell wall bisynthesis n=1 Tax=Natrinema salaciae TaxID=1186196 RepID=A0A1H8ZWW5_9EURY|nr:glycosyltransferase family 4 protein [Natrinema salaciae]SEP68815.1 Glycosyltransferase involved in cell wall bisynthesis [Natrinema salaciae]